MYLHFVTCILSNLSSPSLGCHMSVLCVNCDVRYEIHLFPHITARPRSTLALVLLFEIIPPLPKDSQCFTGNSSCFGSVSATISNVKWFGFFLEGHRLLQRPPPSRRPPPSPKATGFSKGHRCIAIVPYVQRF